MTKGKQAWTCPIVLQIRADGDNPVINEVDKYLDWCEERDIRQTGRENQTTKGQR